MSSGTENPENSHTLSPARLAAIRAYTDAFGGTLEKNAAKLKGVSSAEIYQMIEDAQNGQPAETP